MSETNPGKTDIQQVFKRLRSATPNKVCYDCGSKNPTWASITYGIFICIDCSGIHRSLGVHLTFIRSTNLDTNWTWQQLRQMQLGGNSKAQTFFRSHNCTTTDTQQKYNSRAAQLYREKLHQLAAQAMRLHGTKLHIDGGTAEPVEEAVKEETDFFENTEQFSNNVEKVVVAGTTAVTKTIENGAAPDVSMVAAESSSASSTARKSTIGVRKTGTKKPGGLGGKKGGMGATKVTKDFSQIEKEAEMADNIAVTRKEEAKVAAKTEEEEAAQMASMRLAYQDLSLQKKKNDQKMAKMDPKKAEQMERLGMGFGGGLGVGAKSHSLVSDMGVIQQEEPSGGAAKKTQFQTSTKEKFFDDFEVVEAESDNDRGGWGGGSRVDEICAAGNSNTSGRSAWEQDLNENLSKSAAVKTSVWDSDFDSKPKKTPVASSEPVGEEATKKFGNAKSISSDMFFGGDEKEKDANLTRFQGSNSISSDMYFNRETAGGGGGGVGMSKSNSSYGYNMQAPDMDDVKESVRQGVSKLGGRLSGMASGVMSQIQDKYGY